MTSAAVRTVGEGDDPRHPAPVPRAEQRRRRRERRLVISTGLVLLAVLVGLVAAVLGHLGHGRGPAPRGMIHTVTSEVHVTEQAA